MAKKRNQYKKPEKICNESLDRISGLPSPVLYHLLSFLPADDVVRTSALSRHWRTIWSSAPVYDLDEKVFSSDELDFFDFVDNLLLLRDGSNILKFRLLVDYREDEDDVGRINAWIIYAVRHKVEVLDIGIDVSDYDSEEDDDIKLTTSIFTCKSLRELKFSSTILNLPPLNLISLPGLKVLHICKVFFEDGQLGKALFSAIPSLESFILEDCSFEEQSLLVIFAHQLKNLTVKGKLPYSIEINTPNLISIELNPRNNEFPDSIKFKSSLVHLMHANIPLKASCFESMIKLFRIIRSTQSLTLSALSISSFSAKLKEDGECIEAPFHNLKWLKLGTTFSDSDIMVINTILNHSPHVESIFLENETGTKSDGENCKTTTEELVETKKVWFTYDLAHLKIVTIQGFLGSENELRFIKFVLENATVLEKLIVAKSRNGNSKDLLSIGRKLLDHPRASSTVGFLFG